MVGPHSARPVAAPLLPADNPRCAFVSTTKPALTTAAACLSHEQEGFRSRWSLSFHTGLCVCSHPGWPQQPQTYSAPPTLYYTLLQHDGQQPRVPPSAARCSGTLPGCRNTASSTRRPASSPSRAMGAQVQGRAAEAHPHTARGQVSIQSCLWRSIFAYLRAH